MALRLKSLELIGYKTFANKTLFVFADSITAIVGPNGSGKSNIADSLRWVLGEQSYSLLRARKTEDMIFSGSEHRPRAGMASATIIFDNSDNWLPIDYSEVAITRKAYRDGKNEYLINNQKVRLKNVHELLAQSGLAERTYTIIGQGLVDAALSLRADERRELFEEAAGIGLYRSRRDEALRRLDTTQRNLERVQDILSELKPRLRSLERQAKRAKEFLQVQRDLFVLLKDWYGYHWNRAQLEYSLAKKTAQSFETKLENARNSRSSIEKQIFQSRERIQLLRSKHNTVLAQLAETVSERDRLEGDLNLVSTQLENIHQRYTDIQSEVIKTNEEIAVTRQKIERLSSQIQEKEAEIQEAQENLVAAERKFNNLQIQQKDKYRQQEEHKRKQGEILLKIKQLGVSLEIIDKNLIEYQARLTSEKALLLEARESHARVIASLEALRAVVDKSEEELAQEKDAFLKLNEEKTITFKQLEKLNKAQSDLETRAEQLKLEIGLLGENLEKQRVFNSGAELLINAIPEAQNKKISTRILDAIRMPAEYEVAISAVLEKFLDAVIWNESPDIAIKMLQTKNQSGIIIPVNHIKSIPKLDLKDFPEDGIIGVCSDLVECASEIRPVLDILLGRTVLVRTRETALRLLDKVPVEATIVTIQGDLFLGSGPIQIVTPDLQLDQKSAIELQKRIRELNSELEDVSDHLVYTQKQIGSTKGKLEKLEKLWHQKDRKIATISEKILKNRENQQEQEKEESKLRSQVELQSRLLDRLESETNDFIRQKKTLQQELQEAENKLSALPQELNNIKPSNQQISEEELTQNISHWKTSIALGQQSLDQLRIRLTEMQTNLETLELTKNNLVTSAKKLLSDEIKELEHKQKHLISQKPKLEIQINRLREESSTIETEILALEDEFNVLFQREVKERNALSVAEHNYAQARVVYAKRQEHLNSLMKQIEDDLGLVEYEYKENIPGPSPLPLEGLVEILPSKTAIDPQLEGTIKNLKAQVRRMGPVNPEAEKEYEEVFERHSFLTSQVEDLEKAEADVRKVIQELDEMMQQEFMKTFSAVSEEFVDVFQRLFPGGSAKLMLTNPNDLSTTGIEIEARLPGKRTQGLSLLSGGERSLTATALIFALLKVSPTPFCVLDEVDAMLDEFNVQRFGELLRELSNKTQFVIITHNRYTVQLADILYGVTMGRDSASQVLSLKLDEIAEYVK